MKTLIHERVEQAREGKNPYVICEMPDGWAVLGDYQYLRGYCLLLPDPVVPDLNYLDEKGRSVFLLNMTIIGDALIETLKPYRINYAILGNKDPALHAHIQPRLMSESEELRSKPVWVAYDKKTLNSIPFDLARDKILIQDIKRAIQKRS